MLENTPKPTNDDGRKQIPCQMPFDVRGRFRMTPKAGQLIIVAARQGRAKLDIARTAARRG
jgi:hypothetical protein